MRSDSHANGSRQVTVTRGIYRISQLFDVYNYIQCLPDIFHILKIIKIVFRTNQKVLDDKSTYLPHHIKVKNGMLRML